MQSLKQLLCRKKIVIFDLDDTIMYTFQNGYKKFVFVEKKLNLPLITYSNFRLLYGKISFDACIKKLHPEIEVSLFKEEYNKVCKQIPYRAVVDLETLLNKMEVRGIKVGIITNSEDHERVLQKIVCAGGSLERFEFICSGKMLIEKKPSPKAILCISELEKYHKNEILYIADDQSDLEFSKNLGIDFIAVGTGPHEWNTYDVTYYLDSIQGLVKLL